MLLSKTQLSRFWRDWSAIAARNHWGPTETEIQRHALLTRAGFTSLTLVDRTDGFSRVLKELAALQDNLAGMLRADDNPRRVLLYTIRATAKKIVTRAPYAHPSAIHYIQSLSLDKFGTIDWESLSNPQLEQLRFTLSARLSGKRHHDQVAAAAPELLPATDSNVPF